MIDAALESGRLWSENLCLETGAWRKHSGELRLADSDREELRGVVELLDSADSQVRSLRRHSKSEPLTSPQFVESLRTLRDKLDGAIGILDKELSGAGTTLARGRLAGAAGLALVALVIAVPPLHNAFGGPQVTESSLARQLHGEIPGSDRVICTESTVFDGSYRCAVEFPGCHRQLEASISKKPACSDSPPQVDVLKVYADDDCYEATRFEQILSQLPSSQSSGKTRPPANHSGCIEG